MSSTVEWQTWRSPDVILDWRQPRSEKIALYAAKSLIRAGIMLDLLRLDAAGSVPPLAARRLLGAVGMRLVWLCANLLGMCIRVRYRLSSAGLRAREAKSPG